MQLDAKMVDKVEALALLLQKSPETVVDEALDFYLKKVREEMLEEDLAEQRKETNLSYDEFWDGVDFE